VRKHIHGYLKDFLFDPGLVEARVGTLSGGERSRLLLAREFARFSNLWCWTSRPTTSIWKRSTCCRK
jgi:ATPase subunit of ABC transporter with duplicated ATPase domains